MAGRSAERVATGAAAPLTSVRLVSARATAHDRTMRPTRTITLLVALATACTVRMAETPRPVAPGPSPAQPTAPTYPGVTLGAPAATPTASATTDPHPNIAGSGGQLAWSNFTSSSGETPVTGCKKDTKEHCHDGVDNDCDGRVDEGCPYGAVGTPLHFMIAWTAAVDLDMRVVTPSGKSADRKSKDSGSLVFDKDCHTFDCPSGMIEDAYLPPTRLAERGRYKIVVELADEGGAMESTVALVFSAEVGGRSFYVPMKISNKKGEKKSFELDVN